MLQKLHRPPLCLMTLFAGLGALALVFGCGSRSSLLMVEGGIRAEATPAPDGRTTDLPVPAPDLGPSNRITGEHDSCEYPGQIDLAPLSTAEQIAVLVDTTGAANDYHNDPLDACAGLEDVVAQVVNIEAARVERGDSFTVACHGGGEYALGAVATHAARITCSGRFFLSPLLPCDGSPAKLFLGTDADFVLFCRSSDQGPMHLSISKAVK